MYTPVNPNFTIYKWGVRVFVTRGSFRDVVTIVRTIASEIYRMGNIPNRLALRDKLNF